MTDNDKEIEAGINRACECDCGPPSTGWTVNPFPIIRDYIERLKRRAEVAELACRIATDKIYDYCYEEAIAQAEREITGEKND